MAASQWSISPRFSCRYSSDDPFITLWRSCACVAVKHIGCHRLSYVRQHWREGTHVNFQISRFASRAAYPCKAGHRVRPERVKLQLRGVGASFRLTCPTFTDNSKTDPHCYYLELSACLDMHPLAGRLYAQVRPIDRHDETHIASRPHNREGVASTTLQKSTNPYVHSRSLDDARADCLLSPQPAPPSVDFSLALLSHSKPSSTTTPSSSFSSARARLSPPLSTHHPRTTC